MKFDELIEAVRRRAAVRVLTHPEGREARFPCFAHGGDDPDAGSLYEKDRRAFFKCHTKGCTEAEFLAAAGLADSDLWFEPLAPKKIRERFREFLWKNSEGETLAIQTRTDYRIDPSTGKRPPKEVRWAQGTRKQRIPLYGSETLADLPTDERSARGCAIISEGAKDAETIRAAGLESVASLAIADTSHPDSISDEALLPLLAPNVLAIFFSPDHDRATKDAKGKPLPLAKMGQAAMLRLIERFRILLEQHSGPAPVLYWIDAAPKDAPHGWSLADGLEGLDQSTQRATLESAMRCGEGGFSSRLFDGEAWTAEFQSLRARWSDAAPPQPELPGQGVPSFSVGSDTLAQNTADAISILADEGRTFQRSNILVRVTENADRSQSLSTIDAPFLRLHLSEKRQGRSLWSRTLYDQHGELREVSIDCPKEVPKTVLSAFGENWKRIPFINYISPFPILREDGTVRTEPGLDPVSFVFFSPRPSHVALWEPIPLGLTQRDAADALKEAEEPFRDFQFVHPWGKASALSLPLALLSRHLFADGLPLFCFDATVPGTGKSLLAECMMTLGTGALAPTRGVKDETEVQKELLTAAMEGARIFYLDNVKKPLWDIPTIERTITTQRLADRLLGTNKTVSTRWDGAFVVTGNKVRMSTDLSSRSVRVDLRSNVANPALRDRSSFAHPDLPAYIEANLPRLVSALLRVLAAYLQHVHAGGKRMQIQGGLRFPKFQRYVCEALIFAGAADISVGVQRLAEEDESLLATEAALHHLWERFGSEDLVSSLVSRSIDESRTNPRTVDLIDALRAVVEIPRGMDTPSAKDLARWFERNAGAWFGPYYLHKIEGPRGLHPRLRTRMFRLERDPRRERASDEGAEAPPQPLGPSDQVQFEGEADSPF